MPRTRRQKAILEAEGVPATPPQQLADSHRARRGPASRRNAVVAQFETTDDTAENQSQSQSPRHTRSGRVTKRTKPQTQSLSQLRRAKHQPVNASRLRASLSIKASEEDDFDSSAANQAGSVEQDVDVITIDDSSSREDAGEVVDDGIDEADSATPEPQPQLQLRSQRRSSAQSRSSAQELPESQEATPRSCENIPLLQVPIFGPLSRRISAQSRVSAQELPKSQEAIPRLRENIPLLQIPIFGPLSRRISVPLMVLPGNSGRFSRSTRALRARAAAATRRCNAQLASEQDNRSAQIEKPVSNTPLQNKRTMMPELQPVPPCGQNDGFTSSVPVLEIAMAIQPIDEWWYRGLPLANVKLSMPMISALIQWILKHPLSRDMEECQRLKSTLTLIDPQALTELTRDMLRQEADRFFADLSQAEGVHLRRTTETPAFSSSRHHLSHYGMHSAQPSRRAAARPHSNRHSLQSISVNRGSIRYNKHGDLVLGASTTEIENQPDTSADEPDFEDNRHIARGSSGTRDRQSSPLRQENSDPVDESLVNNILVTSSGGIASEVPSTPVRRGWSFTELLPSAARTVSKLLLPSFGRSTVATPSRNVPNVRPPATEPRPHVSATQGRAARLRRHDLKQGLKRDYALVRQQTSYQERRLEEDIEQEQKRVADLKNRLRSLQEESQQTLDDLQNAAIVEKTPLKRMRSPSPSVIPNPPGRSYGLDPRFFDSDDSDAVEEDSATTDAPMSKKIRIEPPDSVTPNSSNQILKGPNDLGAHHTNSRESSPTRSKSVSFDLDPSASSARSNRLPRDTDFGDPALLQSSGSNPLSTSGNLFRLFGCPSRAGESTTQVYTPLSASPKRFANTFRVPSPTESDESDSGDEPDDMTSNLASSTHRPTRSDSPPKPSAFQARTLEYTDLPAPRQQIDKHVTGKDTQDLFSHSEDEQVRPSAAELSIQIQREQALKYSTKRPSRLNQSQRYSSSTVGSTSSPGNAFTPGSVRKAEDKLRNFQPESKRLSDAVDKTNDEAYDRPTSSASTESIARTDVSAGDTEVISRSDDSGEISRSFGFETPRVMDIIAESLNEDNARAAHRQFAADFEQYLSDSGITLQEVGIDRARDGVPGSNKHSDDAIRDPDPFIARSWKSEHSEAAEEVFTAEFEAYAQQAQSSKSSAIKAT